MASEPILNFFDDLHKGEAEWYDLMVRAREIVLAVDPRITEEVKYGGILFSAGSPFCGLFSYQRHVALEFSRGAELPDAKGVLEGEGKLRRHIKLLTRRDLIGKDLRGYVGLALAAVTASTASHKPARGRRPRA